MSTHSPVAANDALLQAYEEVAYVSEPNRNSHPDRMATIAALLGLAVPPIGSCRVLELACGDGSNIIPMAATMPNATCIGVDFAANAIAKGRTMASAAGATNVRLLAEDLRKLPGDLGTFDYVIAHGLYSWVPAEVRALVLPIIARHLARNGIAFVSYNIYPGCHVRKLLWEILKYHTRKLTSARAKLDAARSLLSLLAEPAATHSESDQALRREVAAAAARSDSALFHDDLSDPNDPVYFHQFVDDAHRNGLEFVAEAELHSMVGAGVTPRVHAALGAMERLTREQYMDFVHFRRFRQSLLCHADFASQFKVQPVLARALHVSASRALLNMAKEASPPAMLADAQAKLVKDAILLAWPVTLSVVELAERLAVVGASAAAGAPAPPPEVVITQLYVAGLLELYVEPPAVVKVAGERPQAFAPARWQVTQGPSVTNVYHEGLRIDDPALARLVPLLDGKRTRAEILAGIGASASDMRATTLLEQSLKALAHSALLVD